MVRSSNVSEPAILAALVRAHQKQQFQSVHLVKAACGQKLCSRQDIAENAAVIQELTALGSRMKHKTLKSAILCLYMSLGYTAVLPAATLNLVAGSQAKHMQYLMSWASTSLRKSMTIGSKWTVVQKLKTEMANTRILERSRQEAAL